MEISKEQWTKIIAIVISAALAVAAVLGWYLPVEVPEERAVRERIAIDSRSDCYLYNGADWYSYSDDHGTQKFHVDGATGNVTSEGTLQYGADDLYALGHATSGLQSVYGTASITGTATAAHGLTTVTFCMATLGEDPTDGAGDAAHVSVAVSSNVCTLKAWQDDFVTAASETDVAVHWLVIGAP